MKALTPTFVAGLLLLTLGCREDVQSPSDVESTLAFAATQALVFRQLTTGSTHSCGVTVDDKIYCWGSNFHGQLGNGSTLPRSRPVAVASGLHFTMVSAGRDFTCALTTTHKAYCWGMNIEGQLGNGTRDDRLTPGPVKGDLLFQHIRPGGNHTCGTTTTSIGYCWGSNAFGQLGIGITDVRKRQPTRVSGTILFRRVIAGSEHTCALTMASRAYCWGHGTRGALGNNTTTFKRYTPVLVSGDRSYTQVVAGAYHSCGVTTAKRAYCWGENIAGTLGDGTRTYRTVPVAVVGGLFFNGVSPAGQHTCGVSSTDLFAWCWGESPVVNNVTAPSRIPGTVKFSEIAGGIALHHACALTSGGTAYCWGFNRTGQLGDGTTTDRATPAPVAPPS